MIGIEIVAKLAELQKQYDDAHRPTRPLEAYRRRHARRHPKLDFDGEQHVPQYRAWSRSPSLIRRTAERPDSPLLSASALNPRKGGRRLIRPYLGGVPDVCLRGILCVVLGLGCGVAAAQDLPQFRSLFASPGADTKTPAKALFGAATSLPRSPRRQSELTREAVLPARWPFR